MRDPLLRYYFLDITTVGVSADIGLNGVPILTDGKGVGVRTILPVNEWLWSGENFLTIHLAWPEQKPHEPGEAEVKVSLFEADPNTDMPEPHVVHAEVVWPQPAIPELYPHVFKMPAQIKLAPPAQLWAEAEVVEKLNDGHKQEILTLVEQLRQALMNRNAEAALKLLAYRYQDEARAYGANAEVVLGNVAKQYEIMWSEPTPRSAPLDPDAVTFIQGAGNKLLKVAGPNFNDAVVINTEAAEYQIQVYAAKIGGQWRIAR